jgi:hypothetical protein
LRAEAQLIEIQIEKLWRQLLPHAREVRSLPFDPRHPWLWARLTWQLWRARPAIYRLQALQARLEAIQQAFPRV